VRNIAETKLNETSSRSHTVFRINIQSSCAKDGSIKISQLNLVDLAGSEGVSKTQADGIRLREGSNINRSLLALSNVINKLSTGSKQFINFRDSKLTRILQKALGGNSSTAIICTMTQTISNY
jgi:centromeric protein E